MGIRSVLQVFFILLGLLTIASMVARTRRTKAVFAVILDTRNFDSHCYRKRDLYKVRCAHLFSCVMLCWFLLSARVHMDSSSTSFLSVDAGKAFCNEGKDLKYCSIESKNRDTFGIIEDCLYPKRSAAFSLKKSDIYSQIFSFSENINRVFWAFPASLPRYFHELEKNTQCTEKSRLMNFEWARYETFKTFPMDCPVMPIRLSSNGFYYNGSSDSVTCFSCGLQHQGWKGTDIVSNVHARLSPSCSFLRGLDDTNVGIHSEEAQGAQGGRDIETDNSFGHEEIVVQRHCRTRQSNESAVRVPHKYPEYDTYRRRMDSFTGWPYPEVIEPCVLADGGFFFVGSGDCVRCFSCGGGLRNWEYGDGPWAEHARWFPRCTFLRERKGPDFIRQYTNNTDDEPACSLETDPVSQTSDTSPSSRVAKTLSDMGFSETDIKAICQKMDLQGITDITDTTLSTIIDELLVKLEESAQNTTTEQARLTDSSHSKKDQESTSSLTTEMTVEAASAVSSQEPKMLQEENLTLKKQLNCKICMENGSDQVFLPCGHMVSCDACAKKIRKCPICRHLIESRLKAVFG